MVKTFWSFTLGNLVNMVATVFALGIVWGQLHFQIQAHDAILKEHAKTLNSLVTSGSPYITMRTDMLQKAVESQADQIKTMQATDVAVLSRLEAIQADVIWIKLHVQGQAERKK